MLSDTLKGPRGKRLSELRLTPYRMQRIRKRGRIVRRNQQAAAGALHDLDKGTTARLHHGDAAGHRLQEKHTLRLVVCRGNGEDVEASQECELSVAIEFAAIRKLPTEARIVHAPAHRFEVPLVGTPEIPGNLQPHGRWQGPLPQLDVRIRQNVQSLLGRNPREIAYC